MNPYIRILRPNVCLLTVLGVIVGALVAGTASLTITFGIALVAAFIICGAGDVINDYFDREIDKINAPHRPIPSGKISPASAKKYFYILTIVGVILAYFVSITYLAIAIVNWAVAAAYPWKAKKIPIIKNIFVAYLAAASFLAAGFISGITITGALLFLVLVGFIGTVAREIVKDIEDVKGDIAGGVKTLPTIIGEKKAKAAAYILVVINCVLLIAPYYPFGLFGFAYLIGAGPAIIVALASAAKPAAKAQKMLKVTMYLTILGFLIGSIAGIFV